MADGDRQLEWLFRSTLWLWLFPYIFWFFAKRMVASIIDWVTEPEEGAAGRRGVTFKDD